MNLNTKSFKYPCRSGYLVSTIIKRLAICIIIMTYFQSTVSSQTTTYKDPSWWFGVAGGANFNFYDGTTYRLSETRTVTTPFRYGHGIGVFVAPLLEYHHPNTRLGFMLQEGLDNRRAEFEQGNDHLFAHISYFSVEPSLRLAPFKSGFYIYGGPRFGFLVSSSIKYTRPGFADYPDRTANPDAKAYMNSLRKNPIGAQIGMGYDFRVTPKGSHTQFIVSPFISWFPTGGEKSIRTIDRLYLNTVRAGIALKFGRGRKITTTPVVPPPPPVLDRDGDGVPDAIDKCPDVPGLASLQGCPDRDGDGITDAEDKCPDVAGLARYQGCPIPDRDNDGVNDEVDKCPDVPGLTRYQGCPIPDTDGDGVNDEEDKCINEKGPASNFGCPVISQEIIKRVTLAAKNIFFATASDKLLAKSNTKLNDVVAILNENPSYKIQIDGHTDDQGKDEYNMDLSNRRAASVKAYLVSKGIAENRLGSTGYGETKPVADNKTAQGRAQNRRVEMTLSNY
jgi:outer membrane protein OmpA-like peptidoglycan-associated protein